MALGRSSPARRLNGYARQRWIRLQQGKARYAAWADWCGGGTESARHVGAAVGQRRYDPRRYQQHSALIVSPANPSLRPGRRRDHPPVLEQFGQFRRASQSFGASHYLAPLLPFSRSRWFIQAAVCSRRTISSVVRTGGGWRFPRIESVVVNSRSTDPTTGARWRGQHTAPHHRGTRGVGSCASSPMHPLRDIHLGARVVYYRKSGVPVQ